MTPMAGRSQSKCIYTPASVGPLKDVLSGPTMRAHRTGEGATTSFGIGCALSPTITPPWFARGAANIGTRRKGQSAQVGTQPNNSLARHRSTSG